MWQRPDSLRNVSDIERPDPEGATYLNNLAQLLQDINRPAEAEPLLDSFPHPTGNDFHKNLRRGLSPVGDRGMRVWR